MKTILTFIKRHFELNLHEARSVIAGVGIIVFLLAIIWGFDKYTIQKEKDYILKRYDNLEIVLEELQKRKPNFKAKKRPKAIIEFQEFNPNVASLKVLKQNGIPDFLAKRIIKFRNAGKVYKHKKDVLSVYGFSELLYEKLEPYIQYPKQKIKPVNKNTIADSVEKNWPVFKPKKIEAFDINSATVEDLIQIKGLGEVFANRIIKYRDGMGGFFSIAQVKNTYGLPDSTYEAMAEVTFLQKEHLKFKVNVIVLEDWKFSLLRTYQKKAILSYRIQHGPFTKKEELLKIKVLDSTLVEFISHYIDFSVPKKE